MSTTAHPKTVLNHEILHPGYVPGVDNFNPHDVLWRKMSEHNKPIPLFKTKCMDEAEHKDRTASMYENIFSQAGEQCQIYVSPSYLQSLIRKIYDEIYDS